MNTQKTELLFRGYERAFDKLDNKALAEYFDNTFISAGPKGTIAENKMDYMAKAKQAGEMYKSIGQNSAKILSKQVTPISDEYVMATVHWGVKFKKTGDKVIQFDVSYIVRQTGDEAKIILFINHQDEEETMKKLGLKPELIN